MKNEIVRILNKKFYYTDTARLLLSYISGRKVLSVGCGSGNIEHIIAQYGSKEIIGLEISKSENTKIPIQLYGGNIFPLKNKSFDSVIFVYSLHHTKNFQKIRKLLEEATRVTKREIIILDHIYNNVFERIGLGFFDLFWNKIIYLKLKMPITYNYLKEKEWIKLLDELCLKVERKENPFRSSIFFKLVV